MARCFLGFGVLLAASLTLCEPAGSQSASPTATDEVWEACRGGARSGYTAHERITACSAIIDAAGVDGKALTEAYLHRAEARLAIDAFQDAIKDCDAALERDPALAKAWYLKSEAHWNLRMRTNAYEDVTKAIGLDPGYVEAYERRALFNVLESRNDRALADLDKALSIAAEKDRARILSDRAAIYYRAGYCDLALSDYAEVLRLKPGNEAVESYIARLKRLKSRGECKSAVPGTALFPESPEPTAADAIKQDQERYNYGLARLRAKDYPNAIAAFRELADKGYPAAYFQLGWIHEFGLGVSQDYKEAMRWYRLGADKGQANSLVSLGRLYLDGHGAPKNYKEAFRYFKQASDQGDASGQALLGTMYQNGRGVAADKPKAISLYRASAFQGNERGQYLLGLAFLWGTGVKADGSKAYALFSLASAQGFAPATKQLTNLEKFLKPEEIARGQALASDCLASEFKSCAI